MVLLVSALVFVPVYLIAASFLGVIEDDEKAMIKRFFQRVFQGRGPATIAEVQ